MASGSVCSAVGCNLYAGNSHGVSFFRFPRDRKRCQTWISNCCHKDLGDLLNRSADYLYFNNKLCANHFDDSQFVTKIRNRLVLNAIPTLINLPGKILDPSVKATTRKTASSDKVTKVSDHETVESTVQESGRRTHPVHLPSSSIYREMLGDAKLMLTPAVVLERVAVPELQQKEIKENPRSQPEVFCQIKPLIKTPVEREVAVRQLKQDLQKLKNELDKERTWHKNLDSYVEMVEKKHQRKDETVKSEIEKKHQRKDETVKSERSSQLPKQTNCEAPFASPFWIKVEEASDSPDKKVYYVFSGINGTLDPEGIKATNLPRSANRNRSKASKSVLFTSNNSPHETKCRKSNTEEKGNGRIKTLADMMPSQAMGEDASEFGPMNEEHGNVQIKTEGTVLKPTTASNSSKNSPDGNRKKKSSEGKEKRGAQNSMVLVLMTPDGKVEYKCTKCQKCFAGMKGLLIHISKLHSRMPNECNLCHMHFLDQTQFNIHLNVCLGSPPAGYKKHCHICGRYFSARCRFYEHMASHAQKTYGCNACKCSFVEIGDLRKHLPCPLATGEMPEFLCLRCDETFYRRIELLRHVRVNHIIAQKTENVYEKSYSYRQKQGTGVTAKFQGKHYACETCGKRFRLVQTLCKHLPCSVKICSICEIQFQNEAKLDSHMKLRHKNPTVSCSLCGVRFSSQSKLKQHVKLFKGRCQDQLFVCKHCGQSTKYASSFAKHMQTHERKEPVEKVEVRSSNISDIHPINTQMMLPLESDREFKSSSLSIRSPINEQAMVGCESDSDFVCVD